MDCVIETCVRDAFKDDQEDFCQKHQLAADNIKEAFPKWQKAYGKDFDMQLYLERLVEDYELGSGDMVMEVAEYLVNQEE